jgi:hypothetical protein
MCIEHPKMAFPLPRRIIYSLSINPRQKEASPGILTVEKG